MNNFKNNSNPNIFKSRNGSGRNTSTNNQDYDQSKTADHNVTTTFKHNSTITRKIELPIHHYTPDEICLSLKNKFKNTPVKVNNEAQKNYISELMNTKVVINKPEEIDHHKHFSLALIRKLYEQEITINKYTMSYFDIGAGVRSLSYGLKHIHSNRPTVCVADRVRAEKMQQILHLVEPASLS